MDDTANSTGPDNEPRVGSPPTTDGGSSVSSGLVRDGMDGRQITGRGDNRSIDTHCCAPVVNSLHIPSAVKFSNSTFP